MVATLAGNDKEFAAKVTLFVCFVAGAAYCFGEAALVHGHFNDEGIHFHTPWTGSKRESWSDLKSVDFVASCSWYTLAFASGKKIRLSQYLQGHLSAVEMANTKLQTATLQTANCKLQRAVTPNPSLSPRPTTAGVVSPAPVFRSIIGHRAYATYLRGRG